MSCLFAVFGICHRSHSPLCSLFQIPKPTKIQVKIAQLILSLLLRKDCDFDKRIWRHCACRYESAERMGAFLFFKGLQKVSNGKLRLF